MLQEITNQEDFNVLADHICQSWEWGEFRAKTSSIKTVLRLGEGKKVWQILFSHVPYLSHWSKLPNCVAYLPRGPMPTLEELEQIKKFCLKERAIFLKIEPAFGSQPVDSAQGKQSAYGSELKIGKPILPRHTIYIDLTLSEEKLLAGMHEKTRYNVRLAQKKGVVVKQEDSSEALEGFIRLLEETEKRQGFYSHNGNYYRTLWSSLRKAKMVYLLNAYVEGKIAAAVVLFHFKDFLYYPYGGSDYNFRQYMAPQLLHFEAMKLGKKLGCKTYDLWGSYLNSPSESDPWWGFYRLKSGLGGKEITLPQTVDVPLSPLYQPLVAADLLRWKTLKLLKFFK